MKTTIDSMKNAIDVFVSKPVLSISHEWGAVKLLRAAIAAEEAKPPLSAERAVLIKEMRQLGGDSNVPYERAYLRKLLDAAADMLAADAREIAKLTRDNDKHLLNIVELTAKLSRPVQQVEVPQEPEWRDLLESVAGYVQGGSCGEGDREAEELRGKIYKLLSAPKPLRPAHWQPIETAPKDNARRLYLARFDAEGQLAELDFDGEWGETSTEWDWKSANGIEDPTHWAYQDAC